MRYGGRRLLVSCALCVTILLAVYLAGDLLFRSVLSEQRIREAVLQSLDSVFGDGIAVESVSVESYRRVVLNQVRYTGTGDAPLDVDVDCVLIDLRFPLVDLILGRWSPVGCVAGIELVGPAIAWDRPAGQEPALGIDFEGLMDIISSHPELSGFSGDIKVSDGRLALSSLSTQPVSLTLDDVSMTVSSLGESTYSLAMEARWRDMENSSLSADGRVDVAARTYEVDAAASGVGILDAGPLLSQHYPELSGLDFLDGAMDVEFRLEHGTDGSSWEVDGTVSGVELAYRPTGIGVHRVSGCFSVTPERVVFREVEGRLEESSFTLAGLVSDRGELDLSGQAESMDLSTLQSIVPFHGVELSGSTALAWTMTGTLELPRLSAVLTTDDLQVQVAASEGPSSIDFGPGELSVVAWVSSDRGSVSAHGAAAAGSLYAGGVEVSNVVCEFQYTEGTLQLSEIAGSLMGGELGGQLSLSLTDEGLSGVGQGRLRGVMSSRIPIAGISEALDARLDGTVSLTFSQSDGLGLAGQLHTLMPRVAGLTFDDGTLRFTCRNGLVSIDSLVFGLNGSQIVVKGDSGTGGEANLSLLDFDHGPDRPATDSSS